ncbi:hypothetical protein MOQ72_00045 [Saccharopolyspora sp. K220]|uniref:hypothetical protein n=1 Tax=Saccharopolyspora soli TaxID=2926618 RepID=UPI001F58DD32|nr:hypothetical protein [Saccharopolyspora soli]MCI2415799.1 hypothetical protein [Saccharopolyspora soli]
MSEIPAEQATAPTRRLVAAPMASQATTTRAALARSAEEVGTLRQNVESGKLKLDPAAGEAILAMLTEQRDQVDAWLARANNLARRAPLGQNPVADAMAVKFVSRTANQDGSFSDVLTRYRQILEEAHDAIGDAMRRYRELDEQAADSFRKVAPDLPLGP